MKALVTGCAGFVGSSITEHLLSRTDVESVIGIDSFTDYYARELKQQNISEIDDDRFQLLKDDILDLDLTEILRDVDVVFHQAGQPGVRSSWGDEFTLYTDRNVLATQRLLEASRSSSALKRFVYASSSSVYGNALRYPTTEDMATNPVSPYGVTKLAAEHLCVLYAKNYGVPTVSLRYFTVYGPRQRPDMLFSRIMKAAHGQWDLELFGTGEQVRDFTYVDDIVNANILSATQAVEPGAVFNVSGGSNVSVNDVLAIVDQLAESPLVYRNVSTVKGDVSRTGGDSKLIREVLGWEPKTSIEDGLASMYEHYSRLSF